MMEWLGRESSPPCTTQEGASLLILRPARQAQDGRAGRLRLIVGPARHRTGPPTMIRTRRHGPSDYCRSNLVGEKPGPAAAAVSLPPDPRPAFTQGIVGPVNYVFYGIWAVATLILPRRVAGRFMLLRGSDWKAQLRRELGPEVSARLPDNLREGDG